MSLKAYEDACLRAELFGQPLPDKDEFIRKNKHLDIVEFEEVEIKTAENTAMLHDQMKEGTTRLTELNTILDSTQTKINRLKGVCGSITNFFRVKLNSKDNISYSSDPSYVGQTNFQKDYVPVSNRIDSVNAGLGPDDTEMSGSARNEKHGGQQNGGDINTALKHLDEMQQADKNVSKAMICDISKQVDTQMSKLDQMICQADRAQNSLQRQNKQMRSFLR